MKVDVFSLIQNGKRSLTFMSQSLGLAADMDLGTEHLRWMGDTRFAVGVIRGCMFQSLDHYYILFTNWPSDETQAMSGRAVLQAS